MTTPTLVWTATTNAMYVRGPSPHPTVPLGGRLFGYAVRLGDGHWRVRSFLGAGFDVTVLSKVDARLTLNQIGGPA